MNHRSHNNNHPAVSFIAGMATAVLVGGYLLYGPKGKEHNAKISRWIRRAKKEILEKMEDLEEVTEDQFNTIVEEVTDRYAQMKHIGKEKAAEAAAAFKNSWEDMRDLVAEARENAEREISEEDSRRNRGT